MPEARKHVQVRGSKEHVHFEEVPRIIEGEVSALDPLAKLFSHRILGAREKHD